MSAIFSKNEDRRFKTTVLVLGLACIGGTVSPMLWVRSRLQVQQHTPVEQPIRFDHRHHVLDAGIDCVFCHSGVLHGASAGIPGTDVCMQCHNQVRADAAILAPLREHAAQGTPVPWQRVHRLPDHVYFHHAAHTSRGIACVTCHGYVENMPAVWQSAPLTMDWCLDCHRSEANAATSAAPPLHCSGCHR